MIDIASVTIGFVLLLGAMTLGLHIATVMFGVGFIGAALYLGWPGANALVVVYLGSMDESVLLQLPLFILLGEILVRCGATDRMYRSLADWLNPLPGGLLHTNVAASALFSAVSGSSVATAATISTVALPAFKKKNYDPRMVLGSIAAGGSLGNLIPPGIALIIYGVLTNTSVARLYAGGVFPGLALTLMFMGVIVLIALWRPSIAPREVNTDPMLVRLKRLVDLLPPLIIFVVVMGSIYTGWATSTEAAALAVVVSLPIAVFYGRLTIGMLHDAFLSTVNLTALSMLILAGAFALNFVLGLLGVTSALTKFVASMNVTPIELIYVLFAFYVILGTFFETLPMMVGTLPLVHPLIVAAGIDPVWFGVFLVLMCEISLISPPVGMTLYVIQAVRNEGSIGDVFRGTVPFFLTMLVMTVLLIHWQDLALWLPRVAFD
ncbi:MAG TPA: TRAP transporter large permease [Reyranella sp.]|jgi:C4-dicarboxylate transporter DctM subunit|nr:TRAP transporter large permease [Reyranella sp.]